MKNMLMFGSSFSACFVDEEISIAAGKGLSILDNLVFEPNGDFHLKKNADDWNKKVFRFSMKEASNNLNYYEYFIVNIALGFNLPSLLQNRQKNSYKSIFGISENLFMEIVNGQLSTQNYKLHKSFQDKLIQKGVKKNQIIMLLTPFSSLPKEIEVINNNEAIINKINRFFYLLDKQIQENLNRVVLPDLDMLTNGFFMKNEFSSKPVHWQNQINFIKNQEQDYTHMNKYYAKIMMKKILKLIEKDE